MKQQQSFLFSFLCLMLCMASSMALLSPARAFMPAAAAVMSTSALSAEQQQQPTATRRSRVSMMPATTIERPTTIQPGVEVQDRPERINERKESHHAGGEEWEVRIYNDGLNTREYVARSLVKVVGMAEITAYQTMMQAHKMGIASVGRWAFEVAELYHEGLQKNGIVSDLVPVDESS